MGENNHILIIILFIKTWLISLNPKWLWRQSAPTLLIGYDISNPHMTHHLIDESFKIHDSASCAGGVNLGIGSSSPQVPLLLALSLHSDSLACKGATSIFFTTTFAIWKCRNEVIFCNSRASQTKVKLYLTKLLSTSLNRIANLYFGRSLQKICRFLFTNP